MSVKEMSYIDEKIYTDIKINNESNEEKFQQLLEFYKLHEFTKKWHKNDYYEEINLSDNNVIQKLEKYYFSCFSAIDDYKIIRLNKKDETKLSDYEYLLYLKELRLYDEISRLSNLSLEKQKQYNPFLQKIMSLSRIVSGAKVKIINKNMPENNLSKPIIFVLSHVGKDDQIIFNEAIKKHYTILSGDYENLHNNIEGFITSLNGVIFFDMNSKEERKNVIHRVSQKLKEKDNILCSMEAAWNLSPNSIVNKLFPGMVYSAFEAGALILPVAIERFNSKLYSINVSDMYFDPKNFFSNVELNKKNVDEYTEKIRQKLADLKFQTYYDKYIYNKIFTKRTEIGDYDKAEEEFKKDILKGWNFDENDIKRKGYIRKDDPKEVYKYILKMFQTRLEKKDDLSIRQYALLMSELKKEINNSVYPNKVHNELLNLYEKNKLEKINNYNKEISKKVK